MNLGPRLGCKHIYHGAILSRRTSHSMPTSAAKLQNNFFFFNAKDFRITKIRCLKRLRNSGIHKVVPPDLPRSLPHPILPQTIFGGISVFITSSRHSLPEVLRGIYSRKPLIPSLSGFEVVDAVKQPSLKAHCKYPNTL